MLIKLNTAADMNNPCNHDSLRGPALSITFVSVMIILNVEGNGWCVAWFPDAEVARKKGTPSNCWVPSSEFRKSTLVCCIADELYHPVGPSPFFLAGTLG
jgi:hypothetical protein